MVAWNHLEKPDPMDIYKRRTPVGRPPKAQIPEAVADAIAQLYGDPQTLYDFLVMMGHCPGCYAELDLTETEYTESDYCTDCAADRIERERSK